MIRREGTMRIFIIITLFFLFSAKVLAFNEMEELEKLKELQLEVFQENFKEKILCTRFVDNLLKETFSLKESLSQGISLCSQSQSSNDGFHDQCYSALDIISQNLNEIKSHMMNTPPYECKFFSILSYRSAIANISIDNTRNSRSVYSQQEHLQLISEYKPIQMVDCGISMSSIIINKLEKEVNRFEKNYEEQNFYLLTKNMSKIRMHKKQIDILANICQIYEDDSSIQHLKTQQAIDIMKTWLIKSEQLVSKISNKYKQLEFTDWAGEKCQLLEEKNIEDFGICESPINTPSWIFSIHNIETKAIEKL